ncbi:MAG: DUF2505 domain-containing protein [Myxococcota bacterium]
MHIRISHRFPVSPREYWDSTRDPDLDLKIAEAGDVDVQVLERRKNGPRSFDRMRVSPRKELPGVAQRALGARRFSYVQEVESDDDARTTTWKVLSDVIPDKVHCSGTSRIVAAPGGCERIIEGEIKVAIPLVGGSIEKVVVEQLEKSYDRGADIILNHLSAQRNA